MTTTTTTTTDDNNNNHKIMYMLLKTLFIYSKGSNIYLLAMLN